MELLKVGKYGLSDKDYTYVSSFKFKSKYCADNLPHFAIVALVISNSACFLLEMVNISCVFPLCMFLLTFRARFVYALVSRALESKLKMAPKVCHTTCTKRKRERQRERAKERVQYT